MSMRGGGSSVQRCPSRWQDCALPQRQGRVSYRTLKLRFQVDDEALAAQTDEFVHAAQGALDEDNWALD